MTSCDPKAEVERSGRSIREAKDALSRSVLAGGNDEQGELTGRFQKQQFIGA